MHAQITSVQDALGDVTDSYLVRNMIAMHVHAFKLDFNFFNLILQ